MKIRNKKKSIFLDPTTHHDSGVISKRKIPFKIKEFKNGEKVVLDTQLWIKNNIYASPGVVAKIIKVYNDINALYDYTVDLAHDYGNDPQSVYESRGHSQLLKVKIMGEIVTASGRFFRRR